MIAGIFWQNKSIYRGRLLLLHFYLFGVLGEDNYVVHDTVSDISGKIVNVMRSEVIESDESRRFMGITELYEGNIYFSIMSPCGL